MTDTAAMAMHSRSCYGPLWVVMLGFLAISACSRAPEVLRFEGPTMGTTYHIAVVAPKAGITRQSLAAGIQQKLERIDALMSNWRADSEIERFNNAAAGEWFALSPENHELITTALQVTHQSNGRFDITVGPLVKLWGFGPQTATVERVPTDQEVDAARARVGSAALRLRDHPPALLKVEQREIDLAGIAPGYAVDRIAVWFEQQGLADYMIEIGGEVRAAGHNPGQRKWRIGIEAPEALRGKIAAAIEISGVSVSTSGDYRDYFERDGKRYSHTIDPASGRPVEHHLASVTVIAADCTRADALATALDVMGPEAGMAFAEQQRLAVFMLLRNTDGTFESRSSTAFAAYAASL